MEATAAIFSVFYFTRPRVCTPDLPHFELTLYPLGHRGGCIWRFDQSN